MSTLVLTDPYRTPLERAVPTHDVERPNARVIEVSVSWGTTLLHVAHLEPGRDFTLTTATARGVTPWRFVVGPEMLGGEGDRTIVRHGTNGPRFILPTGEDVALSANAPRSVSIGGLTVVVGVVAAGRAPERTPLDPLLLWAFVGAMVSMMALLGTAHVAINRNPLLTTDEVPNSFDPPVHRWDDLPRRDHHRGDGAPSGHRAARAEGSMGSRTAPSRHRRYAVAQRPGVSPRVTRGRAARDVGTLGIFAGLRRWDAPLNSPWAGLESSGEDTQSLLGAMEVAEIGDAFGYSGLGRTGTGIGGGGDGHDTVGMHPMGHGSGTGSGDGYGGGAGRALRGRETHGPILIGEPPDTTGLLPAEVIRRVVLRNLGQVQHCQEQGMATDPTLQGHVVVRFIVNGDGDVMSSGVTESNLAVDSVATCIASAVRRWTFPPPVGNGIVTVTYPFTLAPSP